MLLKLTVISLALPLSLIAALLAVGIIMAPLRLLIMGCLYGGNLAEANRMEGGMVSIDLVLTGVLVIGIILERALT